MPTNDELIVEACVRQLLAEAGINMAALRPGPSGYSSRLWLAETDEGPLLIRLPLRNRDPDYLRSMMAATELASEAGIPTVRYRAFCPDTPLGPVVVQEYRPGERATDYLKRNPKELARIASAVGHWVGLLHRIQGPFYGGVLGVPAYETWAVQARVRVMAALRGLDADVLPASTEEILAAFEHALGALPNIPNASLVHADLYFDNVLVHERGAVCLLDFEHACYGDRFADFGKLEELMFEFWPGSEAPFVAAYRLSHPEDDGDLSRLRVAIGLYELSQLAYFARWQRDLVPIYGARLERWLER